VPRVAPGFEVKLAASPEEIEKTAASSSRSTSAKILPPTLTGRPNLQGHAYPEANCDSEAHKKAETDAKAEEITVAVVSCGLRSS
jgi:hypothetical protein